MGLKGLLAPIALALTLASSPALADEFGGSVRSRALPPGDAPQASSAQVAVVRPVSYAASFSPSPASFATGAMASRAVQMAADVRGMDVDVEPAAPAARPVVARAARPAPATISSPASAGSSDVRCVAMAVYHEARGESLRGQRAVADVVMNRSRSGRWGSGACAVVNAPSQFSNRRSWHWPVAGVAAWDRALEVARDAVSGVVGVSSRISNFRAVRLGGSGMRLGGHVFW